MELVQASFMATNTDISMDISTDTNTVIITDMGMDTEMIKNNYLFKKNILFTNFF